ncbi:MAG: hypothetical protein A3G75_03370 [Verrucomicrobia bacterium RIFCSPLOWO2_12_FULL_64_8]|nr:MAG: hypothetical protein A3G75_03370 [Verrucomicrobia bacterium RIFCSPLOWO2_12_FULL_64_8]
MKLFVILDKAVRGPFDRDQLRQLAEAGAIALTTEASESATGPWTKLQEIPGSAELFPQRRRFEFKAKTFEQANRPSAPPVDHRDLIAAANKPLQPPPASLPGPAPAEAPPAAARRPNEVEEILRINREREKELGLDALKPMQARPNRRLRDWLVILAVINGLFVWLLFANKGNVTVQMFALGGMVILSAGITWIMFFVMDRY